MTVDTALDLLQAAAAEIEEESEVSETFIILFDKIVWPWSFQYTEDSREIPSQWHWSRRVLGSVLDPKKINAFT